jgi:2-polyprenyl-6-methoxyphenol hydroxylase-like FAD-dependent oxidoreductase
MKAIVCGAGIAGLASAYFLARKGWEALVLERAAGLRTAGYMIDFTASGYDAAEAGGLLPDTVECRYATSVARVHALEGAVDVTLTDGTQVAADLLVGADGIHSHVRHLVFGPEGQFLRYLGYHTPSFLLDEEAISGRVQGQFRMLSLPRRQVALYAMRDGKPATFFIHTARALVRPPDPVAELRRVYGDLGWHVPTMLAAAGRTQDLYYDVVAQIVMPRWRQGRVVLVGDAGYAVSLLAGQGASLAVVGAHLLAEAVAAGDLDAGLDDFAAALRPAVREKQVAGRRTADFFVPPTAFHTWLRDAFLNAVRLPVFSQLLDRYFAPSLKSVVKER